MKLLFHGSTILTQDPAQPVAEALLVRGAHILAVGSEAELRAKAGSDARMFDLQGACLLPGFHDSHVHLSSHGLELWQLNLASARSLDEGLALVEAAAKDVAEDQWLLGSGFLMSRWGVSELHRRELDAVSGSRPVFLRSQDHHSAWANSRALELAGITAATPDPSEGVIVRDARGEATGLLLERAQALVARALPEPTAEQVEKALWDAARHFASLGVTTVHHMAYEPVARWRQLALEASREDYPIRVWACFDQDHLEHAAALGLATGQGGTNFQIGGAKFFADGALGSLTAQMLAPYKGTKARGMAVHGREMLLERFPLAIESGLTPVTHAIGDAANRAVLDALEATCEAWQPLGLRPRIEHVQHLNAQDAPRLAELGVVASMQPVHLRFDGPRIRELLPERLDEAHSWRRLLEHGATLALGSDTPVATPDVLLSLHTALTREDESGARSCPEQTMTLDEALAGYTRNAAFAIGWENRSGQLREGYDADLVLLSHDPHQGLAGLSVRATMKAGRWTYRADDEQNAH